MNKYCIRNDNSLTKQSLIIILIWFYVANLKYLRAQTAGSVISSRSPAAMMVRTRASMPPYWQTATLFLTLLQVKLDKIPAAQVTMLTSLLPKSWTSPCIKVSMLSWKYVNRLTRWAFKVKFANQYFKIGNCIKVIAAKAVQKHTPELHKQGFLNVHR